MRMSDSTRLVLLKADKHCCGSAATLLFLSNSLNIWITVILFIERILPVCYLYVIYVVHFLDFSLDGLL